MKTKILLACLVALSLVSAVNAVSLSVSIGTYDTTVAKNAQVTVPVTVTISGMTTGQTSTVSVSVTPKSGLSCATCTNTLSFSSDSSKSTSFVLKADAAGNYDAPFTISATTTGASATPQSGSSSIVVTEPATVYNLVLYNTSAPVKNATDGKYYVPLVLEFTTGSVALENVTIKLDLSAASSANALASSGSTSYFFKSLPANSPVKVSWIARIDHFSVYGIGGSVVSNNYYSSISHSQSGPEAASTSTTTGPAGGGGGGGAACLVEGFQNLDSNLMACIIKEVGLEFKIFYRVANVIASVFSMVGDALGEWPAPVHDISGAIAKPITPLEGDVYEVAATKVQKKWPGFANTVVVARGDLEVDSLAAVAFAKAKGYPILLTKLNELPAVTQSLVKKLGPSKIIIAGGSVAVSAAVEAELQKIAATERIFGKNREETAVEFAKSLEKTSSIKTIVVTDGLKAYPDAALIASNYKAPIVYTAGSKLPQVTKDFLASHKTTSEGKKTTIVFVGVSSEARAEIEAAMK